MFKHYTTLLCLILIALTVKEIQGSSLEILSQAWASQNGEVPINKDSYGFYVDVDLSYYPPASGNMTRMLLGLSNCETLFTYTCGSFNRYNCREHNCTEYPYSTSTIDYPSFSAFASWSNLEAYLDYNNWELRTYAYIAKNCTTGSQSFGIGRGGVIGMGNNPGSWQNYINSTTFSFYFDKSLTSGKLLFRYEPSLASSKTPVTLTTDFNYLYSFSNGYINMGNDYTTSFTGKLIFDIHAKALGFPLPIFKDLLRVFTSQQGLTCSQDQTLPTCNYYGYLSNLPTWKLSLGSNIIEIPPTVYVKNPSSGYQYGISLNIQALSPALIGSNYVSNSFKDTVIIDAQFMSYYYTVFERYRVKLYAPGSPAPAPTPTPSDSIWIILGLIIFSFVAALCVCIFKKKKLQAPSSQVSQEPTMIVQPSYNPAPVHSNNGYVYPQNTYPAVQYAQQPAGYLQQPGYHPPPQQFQQPGYINYGS